MFLLLPTILNGWAVKTMSAGTIRRKQSILRPRFANNVDHRCLGYQKVER